MDMEGYIGKEAVGCISLFLILLIFPPLPNGLSLIQIKTSACNQFRKILISNTNYSCHNCLWHCYSIVCRAKEKAAGAGIDYPAAYMVTSLQQVWIYRSRTKKKKAPERASVSVMPAGDTVHMKAAIPNCFTAFSWSNNTIILFLPRTKLFLVKTPKTLQSYQWVPHP